MTDPLRQVYSERILGACRPDEGPEDALAIADYFQEQGELRLAATALDRAWGLGPEDQRVTARRRELLEQLSVPEHGLLFRYVPAGTFLMGSGNGDPDERPVHPVRLNDYWIAETPMSWAMYCDLMGWLPPPDGKPPGLQDQESSFALARENEIRCQYCGTGALLSADSQSRAPETQTQFDGVRCAQGGSGGELLESQPEPCRYDVLPIVAVGWQEAEALCERISCRAVRYGLPAEAQWEKAARGGRIGQPYSWGGEPPDNGNCDFGHFGDFCIRLPSTLPPNGYGLYGMCGGVWEWTADIYDALAYRNLPLESPVADARRVLRGGSWADCAEAVTVSFRASRNSASWSDGIRPGIRKLQEHLCPNIGFRICRTERRHASGGMRLASGSMRLVSKHPASGPE
jgi:formylglycine-generating enzyme required for sulfatase activity